MASLSSESSASPLERPNILNSFNDYMRNQWTGKAVTGRQYIRTRQMVKWMEASESSDASTNGGRLLDEVCQANNPISKFPAVKWEYLSGRPHWVVEFGLLTILGYGHLIEIFRRHEIRYDVSPWDTDNIREKLRGHINNDGRLEIFMLDFERRRWEFNPVQFELGMDKALHEQCVLPFCARSRINHKGATASLWEIAVEEDFIEESLRDAIKGSRYKHKDFGSCYRFALKSYGEQCSDIYENEKNAFNAIQGERNMVKYLGTFQCSGDSLNARGVMSRSYNILLEYGEDDLNEYFIVYNPPALGPGIIDFWRKLFQIADALQKVHNLERKKPNGDSVVYEGCHADVKPDNILRVQGDFKLADFGFATFNIRNVASNKEAKTLPARGTETYGAPEFFQLKHTSSGHTAPESHDISSVTNTIDTWSFACVISVAVTWVVLGLQGIKQFQAVRGAAVKAIKESRSSNIYTAKTLQGDIFHDGFTVLEDVTNWHKYLRQVMRRSDPISHQLLDLIDEKVLGRDKESRLTSAMLHTELMKLLDEAQKIAHEPISESIIKSMVDLDRAVLSTMKEYEQQVQASSPNRKEDGLEDVKGSACITNTVATRVAHRQILEATLSQSSLIDEDYHPGRTSNSDLSTDLTGAASAVHSTALSRISMTNTEDTRIPAAYLSLVSNRGGLLRFIHRQKEHAYISNFIKGRDMIFIVDNGTSMREHHEDVRRTLLVLADLVVASDKHRVDLIFTFADNKLGCRNVKNPYKRFGKAIDYAYERISSNGQGPLATDMANTLGEIFDAYGTKSNRRKTTLIILTDGVWGGSAQSDDVEKEIAEFAEYLKKIKPCEVRPFTIQFVSFGKIGIKRLQGLNDDMGKKYQFPDVIDHEHWSGSPTKMILGSLDNSYDNVPSSPMANRQEMLSVQPQDPPKLRQQRSWRLSLPQLR
ncbi:putative serine threonine protein kinase [Rosellinia necatrix]|uniref:Putative serine threonine protein kinase n=1 Tax=Rosellinia necatrix TaxID=77044 RepID=A0A1W2TPP4_ROSNE|nr:putative serine threonine protein kinase [Rosellinia necatrix]